MSKEECIRHSKEAVAQARVAYNTCLYVADFGPMQSHREFEAGEPMCDLTGSMHLSESLRWRVMFDETRNGRRPCARSFKPHLSGDSAAASRTLKDMHPLP